MKRSVVLIASTLTILAGLVHANPCTDRRLNCANAFSSAVSQCRGEAKCVQQAHHAYLQCLAVDDCDY